MKKKYLLIIMLLLFPLNVNAIEGSVSVDCDSSTIKSGGSTTCYVRGTISGVDEDNTVNNKAEVSAMDAIISVSNSLKIENIDFDFEGDIVEETGRASLYTDTYKSGTFDIGSFTVRTSDSVVSGSDATIKFSNITFETGSYPTTDENGDPDSTNPKIIKINETTKTIRIPSTDNTLSKITLSKGTLTPTFNKDVVSYGVTVDSDTINVSATATNNKAKVSGSIGDINLDYGVNTLEIKVTSESGNVKTYTILVTRPDNRSTDNTLSSITINDKELKLVDGDYDYIYEVDNNVTEVNIDAILNDELAEFVNGYGPRKVKLENGKAVVEIKVQAENEKVQVYKITVATKKVIESDNLESGSSSNNKKEELSNPKTGNSQLYILLGILTMSSLFIVYYHNIYLKKVGEN